MKKAFEMIGLLSLACFSFYYTSEISMVIKQNDNILIQINNIKDQFNIEATDAVIDGNTIIPGLSGSTVDVDKSYKKMKKLNNFNANLLVYEKIEPKISVNDVYDKYIISGNKSKRQVSLIFAVKRGDDIKYFMNVLDEHEVSASFFVDGYWLEENNELIIDIINKGHTLGTTGYNNVFDKNITWINTVTKKIGRQKDTYCYNLGNDVNLDICNQYSSYTIKPNIVIKNNAYSEIKKELKNGSIISLEINNQNLKELPLILEYINSKGYELVNIENLIEE